MPRKQVMAAWKRMELRPLYKGSKGKWERCKGSCQKEKKEEGAVKMNKSKAELVSSWCYQRQAGSMKALQRVV